MENTNKDLAQAHGSMAFFHFLQDRPSERFSRFEAYCFLLDKACINYRPQNIDDKWIPAIDRGQFFITKTELAASWHWHRATVRWFLKKLSEFGHLTVEDHLKGMLCTMHHLIIPVNPSAAVAYNFDSMAKYAMYSYARGNHNAQQTSIVCGQIERSASFMLDGNLLSPYTQKQLEEMQKTLLHYAVESTLVHYPGKVSVDEDMRYQGPMIEKRLYEFFIEHLGGNWENLLTLLTNHTELAFAALVKSIHLGRTEREQIWKSLLLETETLLSPPTDSDGTPPSDGDSYPSLEDTNPDENSSEDNTEVQESTESSSEN